MTPELIAAMLGVRREGVTEAEGKVTEAGGDSYGRGRITVLDRTKLEQLSCECHKVMKKETDACSVWKLPLTSGSKPAASSRLIRGPRVLPTEPDEER
jgi:hypothetical protein